MNNDDKTLLNLLYDRVSKALDDKSNVRKLMTGISKYMDKNSNLLLSTDMSSRLLISENDKSIVFTATNISADDVKSAIKETKIIKEKWYRGNDPFDILSILIIRYFFIKKMKNEYSAVCLFLSYPFYTSYHAKVFKYIPNKEIMEYTINNLSNKVILKQEGSIQGMLERTVLTAIENYYKDDIINCSDKNILDILFGIRTRIKSNIKHIQNEFYKNHENEKFIFIQQDEVSDTTYKVSDNVSFVINRLVSSVSSSIVSEGFDYRKIVGRAVSLNSGCSPKKLSSMLETLVEKDRQSISNFLSDILTIFIYKGTGNRIEDVRSIKFISESLQLYKSNAQDEITTRIKDKLSEWIELTSVKYGKNFISRGKTSMDTYKRAIYTSFIFKIMEVSKGGM